MLELKDFFFLLFLPFPVLFHVNTSFVNLRMCDLNLGWGRKNNNYYTFCTEDLDESRKKKKSHPCVKFASSRIPAVDQHLCLNVIIIKAFPHYSIRKLQRFRCRMQPAGVGHRGPISPKMRLGTEHRVPLQPEREEREKKKPRPYSPF